MAEAIMGIFLEGQLSFTCSSGVVHVADEHGERVSIGLHDFYRALSDAIELEKRLREQRGAQIVKLGARGPTFIMER